MFIREHNDAAEKPAVGVVGDAVGVVMEWPSTDHVVADVEHVSPALAGANLVRAAAVARSGTERPCAVGVNAVGNAVDMQTVRGRVTVQDMDAQAVARMRVDYRAGDAVVVRRLVDIS